MPLNTHRAALALAALATLAVTVCVQAQPLSAETQRFRALYQELIEINSSHSGGGTPTRATWALIQPYLNANCGTNFAP
jgi:hypothetical protein